MTVLNILRLRVEQGKTMPGRRVYALGAGCYIPQVPLWRSYHIRSWNIPGIPGYTMLLTVILRCTGNTV